MGKVIVVITILLILVVGGGLVFMNMNNGNSTKSSTSSSTNNSESNMDMKSGTSASSTPEATNSVSIANFAFSPAAITVKKGVTVTWTNNDSTTHTVTEMDNQDGPNSGNVAPGKTYTFTYNTTGTFKYRCSIHPSMTGTVTVTE